MIFWTGDGDAVLSNFLGSNRANNWFGNRNRNSDEGFRFFAHDAEHTLGNSTSRPNRTGPFSGSNQNNFLYANPQWMHQDLMANAEYRLHFADRVQKHFFRTGALTEPVAIERFNARTDQVRPALRAYGARWADARYTPSYNTGLWETEIAWITNSWMPGRTATVLIQLRADALYPDLRSPLFEDITGTAQPDGEVSNGFQLHLTDPELAIDGTIYYTLDGSDPRSVANPPPLISPGAIEYTGAITINGPTTVNARLFRDHEWSALTAASFHTGSAGPSDQNLVISQIQYHPASIPGDTYSVKDYEYLELMNIGSQTLALGGLHLREDISFDFPQDAFLAPGERVQIVSNSLAFDERHVASPTHVLGEFTRNLSNSGGRLHLLSDSEGTIRDFEFGDDAPWPTQADGDGFGLVLIQPMSNPDHFNPANWRRSLALHGSPGESDTTGFSGDPDADADADGDGLSALLEYALGTSDNAATPNPWTTGLSEDEIPQFEASITRRINADDVLWSPEFSLDLVQWTDASGQILNESIPSADPEFVTEHYRFPLSGQQGHSRTFIRVRVELR